MPGSSGKQLRRTASLPFVLLFLLEVFLGVDCSDWCWVAEELLCCQLVAYCVRLVLVEVVTELYLCLTVTTDIQQTLLVSSTI